MKEYSRIISRLGIVTLLLGTCFSALAEDTTAVLVWGSWGTGTGEFRYPQGVCTDAQGNVYVADGGYNGTSNHRIQKFLNDGTYITQWGTQGSGDGQFLNRILGIATDNQYIYAVDHDNYRIQKFTLDGSFVTKWGSYGSESGEFISPHGIAIDPDNHIYVVDDVNHRVQKFTSDGNYITQWVCGNNPRCVACDSSGYVYITDHSAHIVKKYNAIGVFITSWGSYGTGNGQFRYPNGVACYNPGYIYVCDQHNHRIQKFTTDGVFLTKWGSPGSGLGQLQSPWYVTIDGQGYIYVAEGDNHRIQKFGSITHVEESRPAVNILTFLQTTPNPFHDRVRITYSLEPKVEFITVEIYSTEGRLIKQFQHIPNQQINQLTWLGDDNKGNRLPGGVYFLKVQAADYSTTEKLLLIR